MDACNVYVQLQHLAACNSVHRRGNCCLSTPYTLEGARRPSRLKLKKPKHNPNFFLCISLCFIAIYIKLKIEKKKKQPKLNPNTCLSCFFFLNSILMYIAIPHNTIKRKSVWVVFGLFFQFQS